MLRKLNNIQLFIIFSFSHRFKCFLGFQGKHFISVSLKILVYPFIFYYYQLTNKILDTLGKNYTQK